MVKSVWKGNGRPWTAMHNTTDWDPYVHIDREREDREEVTHVQLANNQLFESQQTTFTEQKAGLFYYAMFCYVIS